MPQRATTPPLAQKGDGTVYLVLDDFGELGTAYRETDAAKAHLTTVVADLLSGQYRHPLRVVAFNTAEGWARDVSADIARKVVTRARELDHDLPAAVSWSVPVRESPPNATVKDSACAHAHPGDDLLLVRHGISVA
jgi:hypothetical protein